MHHFLRILRSTACVRRAICTTQLEPSRVVPHPRVATRWWSSRSCLELSRWFGSTGDTIWDMAIRCYSFKCGNWWLTRNLWVRPFSEPFFNTQWWNMSEETKGWRWLARKGPTSRISFTRNDANTTRPRKGWVAGTFSKSVALKWSMDGVPNLQDLVPDSVNSSLQARTQVQKMQETASQFSTLERELKCKEHEFLRSQQLWFLESPEPLSTNFRAGWGQFSPFSRYLI